MSYTIINDNDLTASQVSMLQTAADEAERGYDPDQLAATDKKLRARRGRPATVGATRTIQVRIDQASDNALEQYRKSHHLSLSAAVRDILRRGLATI